MLIERAQRVMRESRKLLEQREVQLKQLEQLLQSANLQLSEKFVGRMAPLPSSDEVGPEEVSREALEKHET